MTRYVKTFLITHPGQLFPYLGPELEAFLALRLLLMDGCFGLLLGEVRGISYAFPTNLGAEIKRTYLVRMLVHLVFDHVACGTDAGSERNVGVFGDC